MLIIIYIDCNTKYNAQYCDYKILSIKLPDKYNYEDFISAKTKKKSYMWLLLYKTDEQKKSTIQKNETKIFY